MDFDWLNQSRQLAQELVNGLQFQFVCQTLLRTLQHLFVLEKKRRGSQ